MQDIWIKTQLPQSLGPRFAHFDCWIFFKVDSHDTKLMELEKLFKGQASLIDKLKSKYVELKSALELKQVQLDSVLNDSKLGS